MTVKQLIVGTLLGASALAVLLHRLPKAPSSAIKLAEKQELKTTVRSSRHAHRKHVTDERLSLNRVVG